MKLKFVDRFFKKNPNIKFYENSSSGGSSCSMRTDRHDEANRRFSQLCEKRLKGAKMV
jgi:hypothetical protein